MAPRPKKWMIVSTILFSVAALLAGGWWVFWGRYSKGTDDAYVHGNQVKLTAQIDGYVTSIHADDTALVEEGQILVELDTTDRTIAFERAKSELALRVRDVKKLFENVCVLTGEYEKAQVQVLEMEILYNNRKAVVETGAIAEEDYIIAESNFLKAKSSLETARYNLQKAITEVKHTTIDTHPLVEQAKAVLRETYVNLQRCVIRSPVTGIVAERSVQVGEAIRPDMPLLSVIPLHQMWVEANFKEIDLASIRIGQQVRIRADMYGWGTHYHGEVVGIAIGTGAVFSPLPPQNATGNWIKIVQRLPVRIAINPDQLRRRPLRLGLSLYASIDIH